MCAHVHAFLRCQPTEFGRGKIFCFLTQGRMSSATLLSSLPHRYTALCASIVHAVFYLTFQMRQMRLRQGSARTQPKAAARHHSIPMAYNEKALFSGNGGCACIQAPLQRLRHQPLARRNTRIVVYWFQKFATFTF